MTEHDPIIWRRDLPRALDVHTETVRRYMRNGKFPPPDVDLSVNKRGWRLSTLRNAGINIPAPDPISA
ncbi:hypothetical protein E6C76_20360 [Pseudothauera nasutitermitis]|uniref:Uncharacterized protein n=1 Tax=Pseudothauera nasutitermitis TaxID=2565930 RepID=A0A4S4AP87_9RHOO|nr:hypothetical protein [Pseudothauera nasutitermitis]THF61436.1 hypothetical protein E6C76_20360 [Pseudothauera nasutitermitis]